MSEQHKSHVHRWEDWKTSQHGNYAHQQARAYADKHSDPILDPRRYTYLYWQIMANYGWRPYIPGMPLVA